MKLYHAQNSPYARCSRMAARLSGLTIEEIDVSKHPEQRSALLEKGPGGKIPGLQTDNGFLCETLIINNYLNRLAGGKMLDDSDTALLEIEGLGLLLTDCLYLRSHELRAEDGQPSPSLVEKETARIARCYDALDARLSGKAPAMNLATFAAVCALGYANWRGADDNWRDGRPGLAAWYDGMMENADVAETAPIF